MQQNEIFMLLLVILLMNNENDGESESGLFGSLNSMIIVVLMLTSGNLFGGDRRNKCGCGDECRCESRCGNERLARPFEQ